MAEKIKIQGPIIDAAIVVGGGALLDTAVKNVAAIDNILANLPADVMGISIRLFLFGAIALIVTKTYILKT